MFAGVNMFLGPTQTHFNPSRSKNETEIREIPFATPRGLVKILKETIYWHD